MDILNNRYYTLPNSSIYIYVTKVFDKNDKVIVAEIAYITRQGTPVGLEQVVLELKNIQHWIPVSNIPFSF